MFLSQGLSLLIRLAFAELVLWSRFFAGSDILMAFGSVVGGVLIFTEYIDFLFILFLISGSMFLYFAFQHDEFFSFFFNFF